MSASGNYIPPTMIFPRKRMSPNYFVDAPPDTKRMVTETGYMNKELFIEWLAHFKAFSRPSHESLILLILDNHSSHCSVEVHFYELPGLLIVLPNHVTY
jgi:hypothetical protein